MTARPEALVVAVEAAEPALGSGARVEVEWVDDNGVGQISGRVESAWLDPTPLLEIELTMPPRLLERREHIRVPVALEVSGWSLVDATRRLSGRTINAGDGGALLELPMAPSAASMLELRIGLPDGPLHARARVLRREEPHFVAVAFEPMPAEDGERLSAFISQQRTLAMFGTAPSPIADRG